MEQNRGNWYLLTGLILGLVFGMIFAWVISPVREVDTHPNLLRDDYKDIYRSLISRAYQANNNLPRAEARLELIGDNDPALALAAQAQRFLAENGDNEMAKVLANLSAALQISSGPAATPIPPTVTAISENETSNGSNSSNSENNGQDSATSTREPTSEALSSPTPSPTSSPPFILQDSSPICDPTLGETLIQIIATDGSGEGVPGITLEISLGTNPSEVFYTGLKPELGLGYADYLAEPGLTYQLEVPDSGLVISDIEVPTCQTESGDSYWGSWEIYITHPN
ncbi:MAG: hypothetical protein KAH12_08005 [Anaerolineales bacterium]|nr:hypothetical protein [Anaerolineales bacterium]